MKRIHIALRLIVNGQIEIFFFVNALSSGIIRNRCVHSKFKGKAKLLKIMKGKTKLKNELPEKNIA